MDTVTLNDLMIIMWNCTRWHQIV